MPLTFKHGWIRQPHDPRDRFLLVPNQAAAVLPATSEVDFVKVPQLNQANEGSCGPNTAEEVIYANQIAQGLPLQGASRLFVYYWTRFLMGTVSQDSGVDNRSMMKALATYGFPAEALWPYDDTPASMVRKPTQAVIDAAKPNCITDYAAVVQALTQMKGVIAGLTPAGPKPFIFGFDVFNQIMSDEAAATGLIRDPGATETPIGGHDVTMHGYTDVDRPGVLPGNKWPAGTFKVRNHWMATASKPWGDGGYGYISYGYASNAKHAGDFWVMNTIPGGVTPPPPPPPPPPPSGAFPAYDGPLQLSGVLDLGFLGKHPLALVGAAHLVPTAAAQAQADADPRSLAWLAIVRDAFQAVADLLAKNWPALEADIEKLVADFLGNAQALHAYVSSRQGEPRSLSWMALLQDIKKLVSDYQADVAFSVLVQDVKAIAADLGFSV